MMDTLLPKTQTELRTQGQRRVNLIWEATQSYIASAVITIILYIVVKIVLSALLPDAPERIVNFAVTAFVFISNICSLVVGFYFGRTNHQKVGGVGPDLKEPETR